MTTQKQKQEMADLLASTVEQLDSAKEFIDGLKPMFKTDLYKAINDTDFPPLLKLHMAYQQGRFDGKMSQLFE